MLVLRDKSSGVLHRFEGPAILGRGGDADLRATDASVSSAHARVGWDGLGWRVRDLRSANGTWLNGARVQAERPRLHVGDVLRLAWETEYDVVTTGELLAYVVDPATGERWYERDGVIACALGTWLDEDGRWVRAAGDTDATVVEPEVDEETLVARALGEARLTLFAEPGDGPVGVVVTWGEEAFDLGFHAYFRILLALIEAKAGAPESAISKRELARRSRQPIEYLGVYEGRVRRDFRKTGVADGDGVVTSRGGLRWTALVPAQVAIRPVTAYVDHKGG